MATKEEVEMRGTEEEMRAASSLAAGEAAAKDELDMEGLLTSADEADMEFDLHPEWFRVVGYVAFWLLCGLAYALTNLYAIEHHDLSTSPLMKMFGYNGICIYFDYTPAREVYAALYPLSEMPQCCYIVLQYWRTRCDFQDGSVPPWFLKMVRVLVIVKLALLLQFRLCFVITSEQDVRGHTFGFLCLQLYLLLVALQNEFNRYFHGVLLPGLSLQATRGVTALYVVLLLAVTLLKMAHTLTLFAGVPFIEVDTPGGASLARMIDVAWMLLAAVLPMGLAELGRRNLPPLHIAIGNNTARQVKKKQGSA